MNERTQALAQAKLNIFEEILNAKGKYSTFSAIDKLQFVERAFNNVNDYYSHILFGLDPNNTKFGFMLGRNSLATTFTRERAIGYNLRTALLEKNPMRVYEVMFHEFRHVWQDNASLYKQEIPIPRVLNTRHLPKPIAKVLDTALKPARAFTTAVLKPFRAIGNACLYTGKNAKYTYARHEASPNEIDADFSAFQNMASVFREGKVNSSTPVRAERLLHQNTRAWVENMKGHALGVVNVLSFGKLFTNPADKIAQQRGERSVIKSKNLCFLSTSQATQVILNNPQTFESAETIRGAGPVFRDYIKQHGEERHLISNFFGVFSPHSFKRYAKDSQYARYDKRGKLIDQEELLTFKSPTDAIPIKLKQQSSQQENTTFTEQLNNFSSESFTFQVANRDVPEYLEGANTEELQESLKEDALQEENLDVKQIDGEPKNYTGEGVREVQQNVAETATMQAQLETQRIIPEVKTDTNIEPEFEM